MCVCARVSTVFLGNRGNSERETWTYYQVGGMHGKIRFWSEEGREAEVSVRQIEIADDEMLDALRVWRIFAGLPVLMVSNRRNY